MSLSYPESFSLPRSFRERSSSSKSSDLKITSLEFADNVSEAAALIKRGQPVAFQVRTVFGLCVNASNQKAIEQVLSIKSDPNKDKPFSAMITTESFIALVDKDKIHPKIAELMKNPTEYAAHVGSICHIRAPITEIAARNIPKSMYSRNKEGIPYMHNLDTQGHPIYKLVTELNKKGVKYVAVTTLNEHKRPEIIGLNEATIFLKRPEKRTQIKVLITDPIATNPDIRGSFPIVDISKRPDGKLTGTRHGHIPYSVLERVFNLPIDFQNAGLAAYSQADFEKILSNENLTATELRMAAIGFMRLA